MTDLYISVLDIVAIAVVLLGFSVYIYMYTVDSYVNNGSTPLRRNLENVVYWSLKHFNASNDTPTTTLAVQTLRNSMIAAIFIGGAALTSAGAVIQPMYEYWTPRLAVRQIILSSLLCISFLNWALVVRYNTHAGFMAGAIHTHVEAKVDEMRLRRESQVEKTTDKDPEAITEAGGLDSEELALIDHEIMERAREEVGEQFTKVCSLSVLHQALGFRFIFFSIPFFFYSAGPVALLVSGAAMGFYLLKFHDNGEAFRPDDPIPARISYRKIPVKSV